MKTLPIHNISELLAGYADKQFTPGEIVEAVVQRADHGQKAAWIYRVGTDGLHQRIQELESILESGAPLPPLFGVPFAIKDNIDVAGLPTTAACPAYAYVAEKTAPVVEWLLDTGAILIGKTNMDQFATGLVGTRSPYGICHSVTNPDYLSGGSSAGSAVAVAEQTVSFSLGTDTAGSGRVPAAFNGIIGLKPSRGLLSTKGVVPACLSLDCVSIFTSDIESAQMVFNAANRFVEDDPYSRELDPKKPGKDRAMRIGIPRAGQLEFFGDDESRELFDAKVHEAGKLFEIVEFDYAPFEETAQLLYGGAWVAERYAAVGKFVDSHTSECDPTVATIISKARDLSAVDAFQGMYALEKFRRITSENWNRFDLMLMPTTGTIYSIAQVAEQPIQLNSNLGRYTNFVNLLDLCALAFPAGKRRNNTCFGVSLIGPAGCDELLCEAGKRLSC